MSDAKPTDDPLRDSSHGVRLQKAMSRAGVASRRDCEALIEQGRVSVNGEVVRALPVWVDPQTDRIVVDGELLAKPRKGPKRAVVGFGHTYVMLHKPRGVISTTDDPQGRRRVTDLIDPGLARRVYPVGRLDADSTGLILLTDDGELTNRLTHPSYGVSKRYIVSVRGRLEEEDLEKLRKGLYLADRKVKPGAGGPAGKRASVDEVVIIRHEVDRTRGDRTLLGITLSEGQNREIRRLMARVGLKVRKLKRVGIGPLRLKGLSVGHWRPLTRMEIHKLYRDVGLKATRQDES
ncbi:pseudouridine synthase [Mucisphaera calidilacus]|uniref:Pseudouridine synthase n=1 Tax=Mucisphaera calidilacus TaxID=2527982 RepID=A0A518BV13_9BACT|nr:pseudouridine synthase [Mucisphaera calidilacus]QDU70806.1 Ribosomal large subunit pseudouridine synthase B [Mucisphaera calidilacus]